MCYKLIIIGEQCTGRLIEFMEGVVADLRPVHLAFSLQQDKSNQLLLEAMDLGRAL